MDSQREPTPRSSINRLLFLVLILILALVLPFAYHVDVGPGPDSIRAMTWDYIESSWYSGFRLWNPFDTLPYTLLRFVFAVMVARQYHEDKPMWKTILMGILAEIQPIVVSASLVYLINWSGDPQIPLYIPIPIYFIIGLIFLLAKKKQIFT
jgi:uncharacterized membrane protein YbhN (UPF0104 family)